MFGQLLPEQANAPDSATTYGFAGPVTGTLPPLLSHQLIPNLGHAIKGPNSGKGQRESLGAPRTCPRHDFRAHKGEQLGPAAELGLRLALEIL
jgi:hypothetical protein